jgi:hypothetical protein
VFVVVASLFAEIFYFLGFVECFSKIIFSFLQ